MQGNCQRLSATKKGRGASRSVQSAYPPPARPFRGPSGDRIAASSAASRDCRIRDTSKISKPVRNSQFEERATRLGDVASSDLSLAPLHVSPHLRNFRRCAAAPPDGCISDSLRRQERMPACSLPSAHAQQHVRRDHWQVRQFRELRHASVRRAFIPVPGRIHRLPRGGVPVVRRDEANRDARLYPFGSSLCHEAFGAVFGSESTPGDRVLNADGLAHGSGVMPRWDCGYARKGDRHAPQSIAGASESRRRFSASCHPARFYFEREQAVKQASRKVPVSAAF